MVMVLLVVLTPADGMSPEPPAAAAVAAVAPVPPKAEGECTVPANWFEAWNQLKTDIEQTTGTKFSLCLDYAFFEIFNGPNEGHEADLFWWNLSVEQKLWKDAKLVARIRGSSNTDAPPSHGLYPLIRPNVNMDWRWAETEWLYLANLFLEQKLFDEKLTLTVGKINSPLHFDTNKVAGWDFLSHSIAKNQIFPHKYHTMGAVIRYDPVDWFYVQAGVVDALGVRSQTGFNTAFHGQDSFCSMYEVGFKTNFLGREGNYRFDLYCDWTPRTRNNDSGTKKGTPFFGVSFDQMITDKLGLAFRYGVTDGDVRTFGNSWSVAGTYKGLLPNRPNDVLGVGFCQGIPDGSYRAANNATAQESIFEAYYKIQVTEWFWIYPDLQIVLNPGCNPSNDVAVVGGLRLKMQF